jgi:hypothetical protein
MKSAAMTRALEFAGLSWDDVHSGQHPDDGSPCTWLAADIRQYSALLVGLAVQQRTAAALCFLIDRVQLEYDSNGDTRFWVPGLK